MKNHEKEILLLLTQFARKPGVRLYHYSTLSTLDEDGRPYTRLRSPTVIRPYDILMDELDKQIKGELPTRHSKEKLEEVRAIDTKYKDTIENHAWEFVFLEETASKEHRKLSLPHLKMNPKASLVCMEALVVMTKHGPTIQRGVHDLIFDIELEHISNRGDPLYDHRTGRYMLLLADSHLASYDDKEQRYYDTVFDIWTAKHTNVREIEQQEHGPVEILADLTFTNKAEGLDFLKKHNMGTIAIKDPEKDQASSIPVEFIVDQEIAEGIFLELDTKLEFAKQFYNKILTNLEQNDHFVSICCPAFGMRHELGVAIEGIMTMDSKEITSYQNKYDTTQPVLFITPKRVTNVSTPANRRGEIVYSEWD